MTVHHLGPVVIALALAIQGLVDVYLWQWLAAISRLMRIILQACMRIGMGRRGHRGARLRPAIYIFSFEVIDALPISVTISHSMNELGRGVAPPHGLMPTPGVGDCCVYFS